MSGAMRNGVLRCLILAGGMLACWAPSDASAANLVVPCDENSLIQAVTEANVAPGADTLSLAAACLYEFSNPYALNSGTYAYWYGPSALPAIASDITVEGNGATLARAVGSPPFRIFFVGADAGDEDTLGYASPGAGVLTLRNTNVRGGWAKGGISTGGGGGAGLGGAIYSQGRVVLERSTVTGNLAQGGDIENAPPSGGGIGQGALGDRGGGFGSGTGFAGAPGGAGGDFSGGGGGGFRPSEAGGAGTLLGAGIGGGPETGLGGRGAPASAGRSGNGSGSGGTGAAGGAGGDFGFGGIELGTSSAGAGGGVGGGGGAGTYFSAYGGGGGGFGGGGGGYGGDGGFGGGGAGGTENLAKGQGGFGGGDGGDKALVPSGGGGAGMGGAIFNHQGELIAVNSTLHGNAANGGAAAVGGDGAGLGGAIFNLNGDVELDSVTIAANSAQEGGALYNLGYMGFDTGDAAGHAYQARVVIVNSILSDSTGGADLVANVPVTLSSNLANTAEASADASAANIVETKMALGSGSITGSPVAADPQLAPIADNGGSTQTRALSATSPAVDTGITDVAADQRGVARPQGAADDIGAFELELEPATCGGRQATLTGSGDGDTIAGTAGRDVIVGTGGDDVIRAKDGSDLVCAIGGEDRVLGGSGNDDLRGGQGKDTLDGGPGRDRCTGRADTQRSC